MFSLPLGICCNRRASLSSVSLQSLSTRHGFLGFFSKVHSPHSSILTQLIGLITPTWVVHVPLSPRASVAVTVTLIVCPPRSGVVLKVAVFPDPLMVPAEAVYA